MAPPRPGPSATPPCPLSLPRAWRWLESISAPRPRPREKWAPFSMSRLATRAPKARSAPAPYVRCREFPPGARRSAFSLPIPAPAELPQLPSPSRRASPPRRARHRHRARSPSSASPSRSTRNRAIRQERQARPSSPRGGVAARGPRSPAPAARAAPGSRRARSRADVTGPSFIHPGVAGRSSYPPHFLGISAFRDKLLWLRIDAPHFFSSIWTPKLTHRASAGSWMDPKCERTTAHTSPATRRHICAFIFPWLDVMCDD